MKTGVRLIAEERKRQVEEEGWTAEHDATHVNNEMPDAAICYLVDQQHRDYEAFPWPWDDKWWKPTPDDRVRELVKAGALIAAEIDRLNQIS